MKLENTYGYVRQTLSESIKGEVIKEIQATMDWNSEIASIHFDWNHHSRGKTVLYSHIYARVNFLDYNGDTMSTYVLSTRDTKTNGPKISLFDREETPFEIDRGTESYYSTLSLISGLLDNKKMDDTSRSMLTYILGEMNCEIGKTACPEILEMLVKLAEESYMKSLRERLPESLANKLSNDELEELSKMF